jgi:hypothetical protein
MGKRGFSCTICRRPDVAILNELVTKAYAGGSLSYRDFDLKYSRNPAIAQRWNIPKDTIAHHSQGCLGLAPAAAKAKTIDSEARKRERQRERDYMKQIAEISSRDVPLGTRLDHLQLHEERARDMNTLRLCAKAERNARIEIAADSALGAIAAQAARLQALEQTTPLVSFSTNTTNIDVRRMSDAELLQIVQTGQLALSAA